MLPRARLETSNGRLGRSDTKCNVSLGQTGGLPCGQDLVKERELGFDSFIFSLNIGPGKCPCSESAVTNHL